MRVAIASRRSAENSRRTPRVLSTRSSRQRGHGAWCDAPSPATRRSTELAEHRGERIECADACASGGSGVLEELRREARARVANGNERQRGVDWQMTAAAHYEPKSVYPKMSCDSTSSSMLGLTASRMFAIILLPTVLLRQPDSGHNEESRRQLGAGRPVLRSIPRGLRENPERVTCWPRRITRAFSPTTSW